jgi:hypothetical protein
MRAGAARSMVASMTGRCYLVYAVAPAGVRARQANASLNAYVGERDRGIAVYHDHFSRRPHGGFVVLDVQTDEQAVRLADPGPLAGWALAVHPLTFSLTAVGFAAQTDFTLAAYRDTSLDELRAAERHDRRYWWQAA